MKRFFPFFWLATAAIVLFGPVLASEVRAQSALDGFDPNANGEIRAVVVQPDGKILIGGDFTTLSPNGGAAVARNRIARLNPDGTLDMAFDPNANNAVYAIALQADGKILVGGDFNGANSIGGQTRNYIARLDGVTGAADAAFNPNANAYVLSIAVQADGGILAGGFFSSIGGQTRPFIARLDATTGAADLSFNASANGDVNTIVGADDGKILVGGTFQSIGGQARNFIARLDPGTGLADAFNPNADERVNAIAIEADRKILVGGSFQNIGGQPRKRMARLDPGTGMADSFDPNVSAPVLSIAVQPDNRILIGGYFVGANSVGGATRNFMARLDLATGAADSFDPNPNATVFAIVAQANSKVLVGGAFSGVNGIAGQTRNRIARLEIALSFPTPTPTATASPTPTATATATPTATAMATPTATAFATATAPATATATPTATATATATASGGRWTSFGNGPGHSGFYPITIGNVTTVPGWTKSFNDQPINPVMVSDGRVIVTANAYTERSFPPALRFAVALNSATGAELWRRDGYLDLPVIDEHYVFLQGFSQLKVLNITDGSVAWTRDLQGANPFTSAVAVGDRVWTTTSYGVVGLRISDNSARFYAPSPYSGYGCQVSYEDRVLYVVDPQYFYALDAEAGTRLWMASIPAGGSEAPAIMDGKAFLLSTQRLTAWDLKKRAELWSLPGNFAQRAATDGSTVYVFSGGSAKAYAAETGQLKGTYAPPLATGEYYQRAAQPLVTNDLVMLSTNRATYIFDKATFQLRAQLPVGGYLSFAGGILYVADDHGNLATFRFSSAPPEPPQPWPSPTPIPPAPPRTNVELVSINQQGTASANFHSWNASINSEDGRFVLFTSEATDLTSFPDDNKMSDLFVRDRKTGVTEPITMKASNTAIAGPSGISDLPGKITPDGRFVLYTSARDDLVPQTGSNYARDVFVRDVQARTTILVSVGLDGKPGKGEAIDISRDGRYVLFQSEGTNLVPNHTSGPALDVYLRDLWTNTTTLVSVNEGGRGNGVAYGADLSGDGRFALFYASPVAGTPAQLFRRDFFTGTTTLVTKDTTGTGSANAGVANAKMSDDGRYVVFESSASNLIPPRPDSSFYYSAVYLRDVHLGVTERLSWDFHIASIGDMSADGQVIAFFGHQDASESLMFIHDHRTETTEQVTTARGSHLDLNSTGRFVVFETASSSFGVDNDTNQSTDIFVRDRLLRTTRLISHNLAGVSSATGESFMRYSARPAISDDGQTVVFNSVATDLVGVPKFAPSGASYSVWDIYVSTTEASGSLLNIATRAQVQGGDNVLIGGFVLTGTAPKKIMIRAVGPSLAALGLAGAMADPTLELYDQSGGLIGTNDNWADEPGASSSGIAPTHPLEAALVRSLAPGAYTAVVRGANGSTGIALVEIYDLESTANSTLANISTRGVVDQGDNVMIAGFIAGDAAGGSVKVLVRALGPTLGSLGVAGALSDPTVEVVDPNGNVIAFNDDWKSSQQSEIEATGLSPGTEKESAVLQQLAAGPYTAIIRGKESTPGVGLIEVYQLR